MEEEAAAALHCWCPLQGGAGAAGEANQIFYVIGNFKSEMLGARASPGIEDAFFYRFLCERKHFGPRYACPFGTVWLVMWWHLRYNLAPTPNLPKEKRRREKA